MAGPNGNKNILNNGDPEIKVEGDQVTGVVKHNIGGQLEKDLASFEENKEVKMNQETIDSLYGKKERILDYLKENYMTPKEGEEKHVEEYGIMGVRYSLTLPSVNGFKCKTIKRFKSDAEVERSEYEKNDKRKSKSSTIQEISRKFLGNMRDFLGKLGISEDVDMNFAEELLKNDVNSCDTGNSVKKVTGLKKWYWLGDTEGDSRAEWYCTADRCFFSRYDGYDYDYAFLFLGLSVS